MLGRISFYEMQSDIKRSLANKNIAQNKIGNQLSTQNRIQELRDDPMAAAHGSRYSSVLVRKETFAEQNRETYDSLQLSEGYMTQMVDMLQAGRALAVRAANGTFSPEDREFIAEEVNQFIEEMSVIANAQDADGRYIFGGARTNIPPFRSLRTASNRMHKDIITEVEYIGSNKSNMIEISDSDLVPRFIPGSDLLWSTRTSITSNSEVLGYAVPDNASIVLNNVSIELSQGDNIYAIVRKINESTAAMNASIDTFTGQLRLASANNEQAWISDAEGTVMQDLGIISATGTPPYNISNDAVVFQETVFDTMIRLRDAMYEDDYADIGGRALASIDQGLVSVLDGLGKVGAITERLDIVYKRIEEKDILNITRQLDDQIAIDMTETIVRWQELLQAQQAAYQVSSQMMQTSLLQYLR